MFVIVMMDPYELGGQQAVIGPFKTEDEAYVARVLLATDERVHPDAIGCVVDLMNRSEYVERFTRNPCAHMENDDVSF